MSVQKKGNVWYVVLEERDALTGRRRQRWISTGSSRKRDALDEETRLKAQRLRGINVVPSADSLSTFLFDSWLPSMRPAVRPSTYQSYEQIARTHLAPRIGSTALKAISPIMLNQLYADLLSHGRLDGRGGLAPKSVRNIHIVIHKALQDAVRWDLLARNPANLADPPLAARSEVKTWSPEQLVAFLEHVRDHRLSPAIRLTAMTGMRRGEVLGLRWSDLDSVTGRLSIQRARLSIAYEVVVSEPKTAKGRRSVALDAETVIQLREHRKRQLEERMAAGELWHDSDAVFTDELGRPIHPDRFTKLFATLVESSGLERLTPHGLRHTHATLALQANRNPKVVSERLGHANVSITLDTYSHVTPTLEQDVADTVARLVDGESP
jgi:integrase